MRLEWNGRVYEEAVDPTPSYEYQLRAFVRYARDSAPVLTSAEEGAMNMRTVDMVYRAAVLFACGN